MDSLREIERQRHEKEYLRTLAQIAKELKQIKEVLQQLVSATKHRPR